MRSCFITAKRTAKTCLLSIHLWYNLQLVSRIFETCLRCDIRWKRKSSVREIGEQRKFCYVWTTEILEIWLKICVIYSVTVVFYKHKQLKEITFFCIKFRLTCLEIVKKHFVACLLNYDLCICRMRYAMNRVNPFILKEMPT